MTAIELIAVMTVVALAGAVQGAVGFGFGLVAVGVLGSFLPIKQASVMLVFASLGINLFIFIRLRHHFSLDRMRWMLAGAVVGVPLGVWALVKADEVLLRRVLGVVLLLTVLQRFIPGIKAKRWHPFWAGAPCGLASGALSGAFATGGPPAVAYVQGQQFDRFRYVASVQIPLAVAAVVRVACLGAARQLTPQLFALSILSVGCAVGGAWLGLHVLKRLPEETVRIIALTMLLVLGIKYLAWS